MVTEFELGFGTQAEINFVDQLDGQFDRAHPDGRRSFMSSIFFPFAIDRFPTENRHIMAGQLVQSFRDYDFDVPILDGDKTEVEVLKAVRVNMISQGVASTTDRQSREASEFRQAIANIREELGPGQGLERIAILEERLNRLTERGVNCDSNDVCRTTRDAISRTNTNLIRGVPLDLWWRSTFETWASAWQGQPDSPASQYYLLSRERLKTLIKKTVDEKQRSFGEVLSGRPAYSELLGYRIQKFDAEDTGAAIYNFFVANHNEVEIARLIDTQLRYSKRYRYRVYQVNIIVGMEYGYANCSPSTFLYEQSKADLLPHDPTNPLASKSLPYVEFLAGIVHRPDVRIYEIPIYEREIAIVDDPPVPPNVEIIPFKGDKNKIMFNLDSNTGEFHAVPVYLEQDDVDQFSRTAAMQNANLEAEPGSPERLIKFKNDDPVNVFEVFRINTPPTSWDSFYGQKINRIVSDATCASYIDYIDPNTRYYYTFRNEDIHGHVSNPTNVYEVELVSDLDMVYLKSRIYDFKESAPVRSRTKPLRKRIQISPAYGQTLFEMPADGLHENFNSNHTETDHPMWGKKFKARITSRSTGRVLEINFKFNLETRRLEACEPLPPNDDLIIVPGPGGGGGITDPGDGVIPGGPFQDNLPSAAGNIGTSAAANQAAGTSILAQANVGNGGGVLNLLGSGPNAAAEAIAGRFSVNLNPDDIDLLE